MGSIRDLPGYRLLIVCLALPLAVTAASPEPVQVTAIPGSGVQISYSMPEVQFVPVEIDGKTFQRLDTGAEGVAGVEGGPALPAWTCWVEIPRNMRPVLRISTSSKRIQTDVDIAPMPTLASDNINLQGGSILSRDRYGRDELFPSTVSSISDEVSIGGKRWAIVDLTPYRYDPVRRELHIAEDLEIEVEFVPSNTPRQSPGRYQTPVYRQLASVLGDGAPRRDDFGTRSDHLGHYVIITGDDDGLIEALEPLIEWKKRKGFHVTVQNVADIGRRPENLADWLQEAWDEWDIPPTFVLLVGDHTGDARVPFFYDARGPNVGWHVSDNQYVTWEGEADADLWTPEGFIGRLPVNNERQAETVVAKILGYEMEPFVEDPWVEGAVLIANGVHSCIGTSVALRELMQLAGYQRDNIHEAYAEYHLNQRPNLNIVNAGINAGVGFVNFRGYQDWGLYYPHHIHDNLDNGFMLPVVTGMVCGTNDFTNTWGDANPESRGEAWIRAGSANSPQGGIACFGPTDLYTHTWFNNTMDAEFYKLLIEKDVDYLGALCVGSKVSLLRNYPSLRFLGNGQTVGYYFYTYILLGDPGMQVWSHDPIPIEVEFEDELAAGSTLLTLTVTDDDGDPVAGAYVHAFQDDDNRFGGFTDAEGRLRLAVDPMEAGDYALTVTGHNLIPVLDEFSVVQQEHFLTITEAAVDDDQEGESNGNGNGVIGAGEIVELTVSLLNTGEEGCEDVAARLESASPWVQIEREEVEYDAIDPGESAPGSEAFLIRIAAGAPNGESLGFTITVTCGELEWENGFNMTVQAYELDVVDLNFLEGELLPGMEQELVISVENTGSIDTRDLIATLYCTDRAIQIRRDEAVMDAIASGETGSNEETPFLLYAAENAYQGSGIAFGLTLGDADGVHDSLSIRIPLGEPDVASPQADDGYGYWAFDTRDTGAGMEPEFDWENGETSLRLVDNNDGGQGNYAGTHGSVRTIDLPFEFVYYGERYEEITVGSNGWLCFGETDIVAWNNQELGSVLAPPAMLCPYWDDLFSGQVYTKYDEDNARFIIEWRDYRNQRGRLDFSVQLYDPTVVPTMTGDGEFIFLYDRLVVARDYADERVTIGFVSPDRKRGMTITHAGDWNPRTNDLEEEMAIRFTTGEFTEFGTVSGTVLNATDDNPMEGVRVMLDGTGFFALTDDEGAYTIEEAPVGEYTVTAFKRHYNAISSDEIEVIEDEVTEVNFSLTHPTFEANVEEIRFGVEVDSTGLTTFAVSNDGNGPLDYRLRLDYEAERPGFDAPWDQKMDFAVTDTVGDSWLQGVTFDGEHLYVTGQLDRNRYPHKIYVLDRNGSLVREVDQYTVDSAATRGYSDLTWNGEHLMAVEKNNVVVLTREGDLVDVIETPERPTQTVTYADGRGTIFTKSITGRNFYELDMEGNVVNSYATGDETIRTYGLAWYKADPEEFQLYIYHDNPYWDEVGGSRLTLSKLNVNTGEIKLVRYIHAEQGARPQGCTITKLWDPLIWTFIGLTNNGGGDRVIGYELGPNLTWIDFDPTSGSVHPQERQVFTLSFNGEEMPEREYFVMLQIYHNAVGDRYGIPVYFTVGEGVSAPGEGPEEALPLEFSFDGAHPNPFNPTTTLAFNLPEAERVSVAIHDLSGRLVKHLEFGRMDAGRHNLRFDASRLSSGVYLARLEAGRNIATQKLVLMR